ncbi:MAG: alpha/beta hydrolase, partial [Bacteroidota bacterium]
MKKVRIPNHPKLIMKQSLALLLVFAGLSQVLALSPQKDYALHPDRFNLPYIQTWIPTVDGYFLNSWFFSPSEDVKSKEVTVVISYGDAGNMGYTMAYVFGLIQSGYSVLTYDYRGFGDSSSVDLPLENLYDSAFALDLSAAIQLAEAYTPSQEILTWSFSMGTLISSLAYAYQPFDYLVAEGLVLEPRNNRDRILERTQEAVVLPSTASSDGKAFYQLRCPVLLVGGTTDEKTPLADTYLAQARQPLSQV